MPSLRKFLLQDEAVIGIKSPSDLLHIKLVRFFLGIIRSWPYKEIGEYESRWLTTFFKSFYFCVTSLCSIGSVTYIIKNFSSIEFLQMGHIVVTTMFSFVDLSRVTLLTLSDKYRDVSKEFLTKYHLFFFKDRSDYAMKTHKQVHLISHLYSLLLTIQTICGSIFFNVMPIYNNYSAGKYEGTVLQNSTFEHSLSMSYPFNVSTNLNGYIVACILNFMICNLCGIWCVTFDIFLSLMVFHLWGHFKILINNLNDFPKPTCISTYTLEDGTTISAERYSKDELLQVSNMLKEYIDYHREIISFTDKISNVFGPILFVYYMFQLSTGCLLLLECAQMTAAALLCYLPLTIIVYQQLIQLSIVFELVGSESEKLKDAVYGLPWECMDIKNRKTVIVFLMTVQEPVHVKAMGVTDVGVTTMAKILKTSFSYFTFLRSV